MNIALLTQVWDWIDHREIDKHLVSLVILMGTARVIKWAMAYAALHGSEPNCPLVIAAVVAPYSILQGAAIQQYFKARTIT